MAGQQEAEACQQLASDVRELIRGVDVQWRALETSLEEAEDRTLREHAGELEKWFGLEPSRLVDAAPGGIRQKTRDRIQKLLLGPLTERMRSNVNLPCVASAEVASDSGGRNHPIDDILEYWESNVQLQLDEAAKQDGKHVRKIRRLEKVHALRDIQCEEHRRVALWAAVKYAVQAVEGPARMLAELLDAELNRDAAASYIAAVPAIVARSVCDWHFTKSVRELEQLSCWWQGARAVFERQPDLWNRLQETEGLFVRRIERGIEEIVKQRHQYVALANFGHSGSVSRAPNSNAGIWPGEAASLLAHAVNEMQRRLRPIRDSAAWRIIDATKSIQRALVEEEKSKERSPWEQVSRSEGMSMLCQKLSISAPAVENWSKELRTPISFSLVDPLDAAVQFSGLLDQLTVIATDLGHLADDENVPDTGGVSYIVEEVLQAFSYVHEDLLAVLDDATEDNLAAWLHGWSKCGEARAGARLEAAMTAMPLKVDSVLQFERRQARNPKLALMRGLQALLEDSDFRMRMLHLAVVPLGTRCESDGLACSKVAEVTREHAPDLLQMEINSFRGSSAADDSLGSPRNSYASRKPVKQIFQEQATNADSQNCVSENVPQLDATSQVGGCQKVEPTDEIVSAKDDTAGDSVPPEAECNEPISPREVVPSRPKSRSDKPSRPLRGTSTPAGKQNSRDLGTNQSAAASSGQPSTASRPATPSWLEPPWPRKAQEVPFDSWSRPGTASTVCDEADLMSHISPKWKFVEGQCVQLRPASSCKRLPPLNSLPVGSSKRAW
jgi:hypothetical protein